MLRLAKNIVRQALRTVPPALLPILVRRNFISLCYHVVSDRRLDHIRHLFAYKTPEMFERDLLYIKRHLRPISYHTAVHQVTHNSATRTRGVLVTFDDGLAECFTVVRPLLLRHDVPAVFFVTTDFLDNKRMFYRHKVSLCIEHALGLEAQQRQLFFQALRPHLGRTIDDTEGMIAWIKSLTISDESTIDEICELCGLAFDETLSSQRPYLSSDQVNQLVADGFTIGGHTKNHARLQHLNSEEIREQLVDSCQIIQALTGQGSVPFAFPFSGDDISRSFLEEVLRTHPFIGLLFDIGGVRKDRPFVVPRIWCDTPTQGGAPRSSIPRALAGAYRHQLFENLAELVARS